MARSRGSSAAAFRLDGNEVRRLRAEVGWTQSQLADKADCSRGYISMIESREVAISFQMAHSLAEALGRSLAELGAGTSARILPQLAPVSEPSVPNGQTRLVYVIISAQDRLGLVHDFVDLLAYVGQNIATLTATRAGPHAEIVCALDAVQDDPWKIRGVIELYAHNEHGEVLFFGEGDPTTVKQLGLPTTAGDGSGAGGRPGALDRPGTGGRTGSGADHRARHLEIIMRDHRGLVRDVTRVLEAGNVDLNWIACSPATPDNLDFAVSLETVPISPGVARRTIDRLRVIEGEPRVVDIDDGEHQVVPAHSGA